MSEIMEKNPHWRVTTEGAGDCFDIEDLKTWVRRKLDDEWRFLTETGIGVVEGDTNESGRMATTIMLAEMVGWVPPPEDAEEEGP